VTAAGPAAPPAGRNGSVTGSGPQVRRVPVGPVDAGDGSSARASHLPG
jgi:hypothetical protein